MKLPTISVIFGTGGKDRHKYLDLAMDSFNNNDYKGNIEYILIESDTKSRITRKTRLRFNKYKYIIRGINPFDIYWIFNIGSKISSGDVLVFHDNDLLVPKNFLTKTAEKSNSINGIGTTWRKIIYLNEDCSNSILDKKLDLSDVVNNDITGVFHSKTIYGGSLWAKRDSFFKIKGFSELFQGWGCADDAFWLKVKSCIGWESRFSMILYHLYHAYCGINAQGARSTNPHYKKNRKLLEKMDTWNKNKWKNHIEKIKNWGDPHRNI